MHDDTAIGNRAPTTGLFVKLDTGWVDNPKMIRAGLDGAGLHATALCIAKRLNTDGWIDRLLLVRYGATEDLIDRLVDLALLDAEGDRVRPSGWLDRNPSQGAIDAMRASKSDGGKRGNHKRWGHAGPFASCPICHETTTSSQDATGDRSHTDRYRSPESETEGESETEVPTSTSTNNEVVEPPTPAAVDEQAIRRCAVVIGRHEAWNDPAGVGNPEGYAASVTRSILTDQNRQAERDRISAELAAGRTPEQVAAGWRTTTAPVQTPEVEAEIRERARRAEEATRERLAAQTQPLDPDAGLAQVRALRESRSTS